MTSITSARLHLRLSIEDKADLQRAAVIREVSISEFARTSLIEAARRILDERCTTVLSNRDRDAFLVALDDTASRPNKSLRRAAAARYKKLQSVR
jgi:uncharacterized protein (DUF1778 family)